MARGDTNKKAILVILYSAFGDLALCLPAFQALRQHHSDSLLIFLTRSNMADNIRPFALFDAYIVDQRERPIGGTRKEFRKFIAELNRYQFSHIYDLHNNDRSRLHRFFLRIHQPRARVAAFRRHRLELYRPVRRPIKKPFGEALGEYLRAYEIKPVAKSEVDFSALSDLSAEIEALLPAGDFALLAPGGSISRGFKSGLWPPRSIKMWPARYFAEIAQRLQGKGIRPVIVGLESERDFFNTILKHCPQAIDLLGKTNAVSFIHLGRRARLMVAGDTGAAHWASLGDVPLVSIFGAKPPSGVWAPAGALVVEHDPLPLLEPEQVWRAIERKLESGRQD
ncbi:MAG: glycosyltransferase family 9 protein [Alphaproteobacteria bacterium]